MNTRTTKTVPRTTLTVENAGEITHPGQLFIDEGEDENLSDDLALANAMSQIGEAQTDAETRVYFIDKAGRDVYLYKCTVQEFAAGGLDEIRDKNGPGDYRIRVYAGGRILTHRKVSIGAIRSEAEKPAAQIGNDVIAAIQSGNQQMAAMMLEGFKQLATALQTNHAPVPQATRADFLQEMLTMKQIFGANEQRGPDMAQMMDVFKSGMEIAKHATGEVSSLDVLMGAVEKFAPLMTQAMTAPQVAPSVPVFATNPAPRPALPQNQPIKEDEEMGMREMMLKQSLKFIVSQAERGNNPETYANMVLDQLGDDEITQFIDRPDWLDFLAQYDARIRDVPKIREWFVSLRSIIKEMIEPEPVLTGAAESGITGTHAPFFTTGTVIPTSTDGYPIGEGGRSSDAAADAANSEGMENGSGTT